VQSLRGPLQSVSRLEELVHDSILNEVSRSFIDTGPKGKRQGGSKSNMHDSNASEIKYRAGLSQVCRLNIGTVFSVILSQGVTC